MQIAVNSVIIKVKIKEIWPDKELKVARNLRKEKNLNLRQKLAEVQRGWHRVREGEKISRKFKVRI